MRQAAELVLNPDSQYRDDRNLRARQRLWQFQDPPFDIAAWVVDVADVRRGRRVLDAGCGNGVYLRTMRERGIDAVGCDLSYGMLRAAGGRRLVNADVRALPFGDDSFDAVLAPHMLYHVSDRAAAATELRRVLRPGGTLVAVTNGADHNRALRDLVEEAVRVEHPGWVMRSPSTHAFSLENGPTQLRSAFDEVEVVRPVDVAPARVTDASVIADYAASVADHYEDDVDRPWGEIVAHVRRRVEEHLAEHGSFEVRSGAGAIVCR